MLDNRANYPGPSAISGHLQFELGGHIRYNHPQVILCRWKQIKMQVTWPDVHRVGHSGGLPRLLSVLTSNTHLQCLKLSMRKIPSGNNNGEKSTVPVPLRSLKALSLDRDLHLVLPLPCWLDHPKTMAEMSPLHGGGLLWDHWITHARLHRRDGRFRNGSGLMHVLRKLLPNSSRCNKSPSQQSPWYIKRVIWSLPRADPTSILSYILRENTLCILIQTWGWISWRGQSSQCLNSKNFTFSVQGWPIDSYRRIWTGRSGTRNLSHRCDAYTWQILFHTRTSGHSS